jgi:hypothetical protein
MLASFRVLKKLTPALWLGNYLLLKKNYYKIIFLKLETSRQFSSYSAGVHCLYCRMWEVISRGNPIV